MRNQAAILTLLAALLAPANAWAQSSGPLLTPPEPVPAIAPSAPPRSVPATLPNAAQPPGPAISPASGPPSGPVPAIYDPSNYVPPPTYAQPNPYAIGPNPAYTPPSTADVEIPVPTSQSSWMFAADALWLERVDDRNVILGNTVYNNGGSLGYVTDILTSGDEAFPLAAGVRLQLGYRFNDLTGIEWTYWGLQQWSVGRSLYGDPVGNSVLAFSPWTQTDYLIGGFDNSLGYVYQSRVNNAEFNYRFIGSGDDRWSAAGLLGIRYLNVADKFTLSGSDVSTGDYENIDISTTNNLLGPQIGLEYNRKWERFQLVTDLKAALFANFVTASYSNLNSSGVTQGNPAGFVPVNQSNSATEVAGLFEVLGDRPLSLERSLVAARRLSVDVPGGLGPRPAATGRIRPSRRPDTRRAIAGRRGRLVIV